MSTARDYELTSCHRQPAQDNGASKSPLRPVRAVTRPLMRARGKRSAGNSLVEFTLVMPVLLLVMTGMACFGFALHNDMILTNAVSAGAQVLAFSRGQTSDPCATAYSAISNAAPTLTSGISLSFQINGTSYSSTTSCTSGASNMIEGATAQITATYPCTLYVYSQTFSTCSLKSQVAEVIQ